VVTGTAHQGTIGTPEAVQGVAPGLGGPGTATSGLVVLRDELGILSVMRCLDAGLTLDPGFQYGYPAESAAMAGLSHPRIAPPLSYVVDAAGQIVAIVCRHVTGVRLSKVLEQLPRGLDVQAAAVVLKDLLTALDSLHRRGVPHRAPDPEHLIVEQDGGCVLVDVGLVERPGEADPAADLAADLDLAAETFVACMMTGRRLPDRRSQRGYFAGGELEGVAARLYAALVEPETLLGPADPDDAGAGAEVNVHVGTESTVGIGVGAGLGSPSSARTAARMLAALEAAAADSFDAGWDGRSRERLAAAARDHRSSRRRVLEFHPTGHTDRHWSIRGWHAGRPRVTRRRERLVASADVMRQARGQLATLWSGHTRATGSHAAGTRAGAGHLVRYLIPLIAFLLAFGLALLFLGT